MDQKHAPKSSDDKPVGGQFDNERVNGISSNPEGRNAPPDGDARIERGEETLPSDQTSEVYQVSLEQPPARKRRSDAGKPRGKRSAVTGRQQEAQMLIAALSAGAVALTHRPEAAMTESEAGLIESPLAATLDMLPEAVKARYANYINPVLLAVGLGMWGIRISPYFMPPTKTPSPAVKPSTPTPTPADNGQAVTPTDLLSILNGVVA